MRVAILTAHARAGDAIGNQVVEKLTFFLERGAHVRVFAESSDGLHAAVRPYLFALDLPHVVESAWRFLTASDLVVAEYGHNHRMLEWLPLLAGKKPRVLFDFHGVTPVELWQGAHREMLENGATNRGLVWFADAALTHSRSATKELLGPTAFPAERCATLPLPVDLEFFCPGPVSRKPRDRLGIGPSRVLLFVGRVAPNKRLPVLVQAVARLRDISPPVHAVIVGDDRDVYQAEKKKCLELANELGIADRVHFVGRLSQARLREAYRAADVFVTPSIHEGFGAPAIEAMACGLPVVAARAAALPETVGNAGLLFEPDDADELARQVRKVLAEPVPREPKAHLRVAIVAERYGAQFVGGAERSLRTIAETLHQAGHHVEVFTTSAHGDKTTNPSGDGIVVHRFDADRRHSARFAEVAKAIRDGDGRVHRAVEKRFLDQSIHSSGLMNALRGRHADFDAILTGPYLSGLTFDIARAFPERTILVPCFHDEPFARLEALRKAYGDLTAMLFHSDEEAAFAHAVLGLGGPGSRNVGTCIDTNSTGDSTRGAQRAGVEGRYIVYCGRYIAEKELPTLLTYFRRYGAQHPDRFTLVCMGQGNVPIPEVRWARDLGFVDEAVKRDVFAGADALILMSRQESLSLVTLEAGAQGTPVIVDGRCPVLAGHVKRGGGGQAVDSYESFATALDDLWTHPEKWQELGRQGRKYVRERYGDRRPLLQAVEESIRALDTPLALRLRELGLERAASMARTAWRERFGRFVEEILDRPPRPYRFQIEIRPRTDVQRISVSERSVLIPVQVTNRGNHPAVVDGPARCTLSASIEGTNTEVATALSEMLLPGRSLSMVIGVTPPERPGEYDVIFQAAMADEVSVEAGHMQLIVESADARVDTKPCKAIRDRMQAILGEAERVYQLPDSYFDVTEGMFAGVKAWIKRKLLNNLRRAYVDVLSRQQSTVNRRLLESVRELAEYCATLESLNAHERDARRALEDRLNDLEHAPRPAVEESGEGAPARRHPKPHTAKLSEWGEVT